MADQGIARDQLRAFIERVERLEEEKKAISDDIGQVYAEAKASGFDTKVMRQVVRIRKQDASERAEQDAIRDLYLHALGMAAAPDAYDGDDDDAELQEPIRAARAEAERQGTGFGY